MNETNVKTADLGEMLSKLPGLQELRIEAALSTLKAQRDGAQNSLAEITAELEVFKHATDYYSQATLGMQAQLHVMRSAYDELKVKIDAELVAHKLELQAKVEELARVNDILTREASSNRALETRLSIVEALHEVSSNISKELKVARSIKDVRPIVERFEEYLHRSSMVTGSNTSKQCLDNIA